MSLADNAELLALNFVTGQAATAPVAPLRIRLMTAAGSDLTAGTELGTSAGYTLTGRTASLGAASSVAGVGTISNNLIVEWVNMPAATIPAVELWDSAATPVRIAHSPITPVTTILGDTLRFAVGTINFTLN